MTQSANERVAECFSSLAIVTGDVEDVGASSDAKGTGSEGRVGE